MSTARKVVRIRRVAPAERLLDSHDVDDMLDVFAMQDAEVVRVDVNMPPALKLPRSGFMRKVEPPKPVVEEDLEELTDGISDGWEEEAG